MQNMYAKSMEGKRKLFYRIRPHLFWRSVQRSLANLSSCWLWVGQLDSGGYGKYGNLPAHHVAWYLITGRIPPDKLLHSCDVRNCVWYAHLFEGSQADNIRDMDQKGRRGTTPGETHGRAKLTWNDVFEIRRQRAAGDTLTAIGERFGITTGHVSHIVLNRIWNVSSNAKSI